VSIDLDQYCGHSRNLGIKGQAQKVNMEILLVAVAIQFEGFWEKFRFHVDLFWFEMVLVLYDNLESVGYFLIG